MQIKRKNGFLIEYSILSLDFYLRVNFILELSK